MQQSLVKKRRTRLTTREEPEVINIDASPTPQPFISKKKLEYSLFDNERFESMESIFSQWLDKITTPKPAHLELIIQFLLQQVVQCNLEDVWLILRKLQSKTLSS